MILWKWLTGRQTNLPESLSSVLLKLVSDFNDFFYRYDPDCDSWSMVAPMLMPRGGVGVAGLGGYLYAVGGNDGAASLQSVERYNPHTNKWNRVAPMNRRRAGTCGTVNTCS